MNKAEGQLSKRAMCREIYMKCVVGKMRMSDILLICFCGRSVKGAHIYKTLPSRAFDMYAYLYLLYTSTMSGEEGKERTKSNGPSFIQLYQPVTPVCQSSQLSASFPFNASFASIEDSFHQHEEEWRIGQRRGGVYDSLPSHGFLQTLLTPELSVEET